MNSRIVWGMEEALNRTSGEISRANLTYAVPSPFTQEGSILYSMEYDLIFCKLRHSQFQRYAPIWDCQMYFDRPFPTRDAHPIEQPFRREGIVIASHTEAMSGKSIQRQIHELQSCCFFSAPRLFRKEILGMGIIGTFHPYSPHFIFQQFNWIQLQ